MKKAVLVMAILMASAGGVIPKAAYAVDFEDFRSETLTIKAWEALGQVDIEAVLAYTNKCLELYGEQASAMQKSLTDYPQGTNEEIFSYWALNDVATSLFIQAESYRRANMKAEAKEVFTKLMKEYSFGQAWDPKGWFWKPAEAAKEKLAMMASGLDLDFGDYTSSTLTTKAWKALENKDLDAVMAYTNKVFDLYGKKAEEMQQGLTDYPFESNEKIFSYWALNDVGTSLYIQAEALKKAGKVKEAKEVYVKLVDEFSYAQCWDPKGWFWRPADAARDALGNLGEI